MKKFVAVFLLLLSLKSFSQNYPLTQNLGSANTRVTVPSPGALNAVLIATSFTDTTAANLTPAKFYPSIIYTTSDTALWVRNIVFNRWGKLTSGTSTGGLNIYNGDGNLTGNREVDGQGYSLRFNSLSEFGIGADNVEININDIVSGNLFVEHLKKGAGNKTLRWDSTSGKITWADTTIAGGVTSVGTGYGVNGGPITTTGTILSDTAVGYGLLSWPRWGKLNDSLNSVISSIAVTAIDSSLSTSGRNIYWRDYVNVKSFGAVGDGTTNNNSAFAAAIATGRPVFVPAGTYLVSAALQLQVGQRLFGNGQGTIKITANDRAIWMNTNSEVDHLNFVGPGKSGGQTFNGGILGYNAIGWTVHDCYFSDFAGTAQQNGGGAIICGLLASANSDGVKIYNNYFYNNHAAINLQNRAEYVLVVNNNFGSNDVGIGIGTGNIIISANNIHNNTYGIKFYDGTNDGHSTISSNLINHNTYPLYIEDIDHPTGLQFSDNQIYYGVIKINRSSNIKFSGGNIDGLDSVGVNGSKFISRVGVFWGQNQSGYEIPVNYYNGSDSISLVGEIRYDATKPNWWIKQTTADSVIFKGPLYLPNLSSSNLNAGDQYVTIGSDNLVKKYQGPISSTYTPTLTNTTNVAASTAYVTGYMRVGNAITVYGKVAIDPSVVGATELRMSLPVPPGFGNDYEAGGTANCSATGETAAVSAVAGTSTVSVKYTATSATNNTFNFSFTYTYTAP